MRKRFLTRLASPMLAAVVACSAIGNVPVTALAETAAAEQAIQPEAQAGEAEVQAAGLTDFTDVGGAGLSVNEETKTVTLEKGQGDHFAVFDGLDHKVKDFVFEADVTLEDGPSAALVFGLDDKAIPSKKWYGANLNTEDDGGQGRFRIFGVNADFQEQPCSFWEGFNRQEQVHLRLDVKRDGSYTYSFGNTGKELKSVEGQISDWKGGYLGILTFNSKASFTNISFENRMVETNLTDFTSKSPDKFQKDDAAGTVTLDNNGGDHFAVYNGLENKSNDFSLEADVVLEGRSAALIFGIGRKENPSGQWSGANIDTENGAKAFRIFGPGLQDNSDEKGLEGVDPTKPMHLKLDVKQDGKFTYTFGNIGGQARAIEGTIDSWQGGYVGVLTFNSKAVFSNITFEDRTSEEVKAPVSEIQITDAYKTNLEGFSAMENGAWEVREGGLYSDASGKGDSFLYTKTQGNNFVYSTDVTFARNEGAAALVFRNANEGQNTNCYALNIDASSKECKFWKWQNGEDYDMSQVNKTKVEPVDGKYTLKAVAVGSWISCYVNGTLVASTGDYLLQGTEKGQSTSIDEGYFGLLNWNGEMTFQNTYYRPITEENSPILEDVTVTSTGDVEKKGQFFPEEPTYFQYVKNNAAAVNIVPKKKNEGAKITVLGTDGKTEYPEGKNIPLEVGPNFLTVISSIPVDADGTEATLTYRVNVHRRQADEIYYNEPYRGQYHYSVKDGWGNDPNGMIYYNGKYHFYYQFYEGTKHGPMHWAHASSTDMIHWEEEPIAIYPDESGVMFNGYIVDDKDNTSGLFKPEDKCRLVALITINGNGQRLKAAYSTDEGKTWKKVKKIAADWEDDPLWSRDFRDPQIFRYENKWFLTVAGGPLRIYSSDNLLEWKCESAYGNFHTECPDLFPLKADDGKVKWLLNGGGRFYKIGDFKEVEEDGSKHWAFLPDAEYGTMDNTGDSEKMNFGKDSYATMRYYIDHDFGTAANPTPKDITVINWMNTWDYCTRVGETVGQEFNGTYNLTLNLGLTKNEEGKYILTQTPIQQYEALRDTAKKTELKDVDVTESNDLLKDFKGSSYEIVSTFRPGADTKKVGFKLRTGKKEETLVTYDLEKELLSIDRSRSGIIIPGSFAQVDSQSVKRNADGSIDLHIYVDRASVEVFAKKYTVAGAEQIFPSVNSLGASVFAEGGAAKADIALYPMNSIWTDRIEVTKPIEMGTSSPAENNVNIGSTLELSAYLLPVGVGQEIEWSVEDNGVVSLQKDENDQTAVQVAGRKEGTAKVTASAKADPSLKKEFTIHVYKNNFKTNIGPFVANGNWLINDEVLSVSNNAANDSYMTQNKLPSKAYELETDIKYERGLVNLFFAAKGTDPNGAYALQFGQGDTVRLFYFAGDTIKEAGMGKAINDNQYHHIKVAKTENSVTVFVDGAECLAHTFESTEPFFNDAYAGLGIWDGAMEVKGFYIDGGKMPEPEKVDAKAPAITKNPSSRSCALKAKVTLGVTAASKDGGSLSYQWYSNTKNSKDGAKAICKATKASYAVPTTKAGTVYYFCRVTNTNSKATGNTSVSADSKLAKVTVKKAANPITKVSKYSKAIGSKVALKPQGKAAYKSSNTKVATVSKKGVVAFKAFGKATITVKAEGNANYNAATKKIAIVVTPKAISIKSLKSSKAKMAAVTWKKDAKVTGYKIQYATKSNFKGAKTVTAKKNRTVSATLKKLKGGSKYYVRIRSYKKVNKKTTVYSTWSKAKTVKVKK